MAEPYQIQVAIIAPTLAVRVGLRTLLGTTDSIHVLAETADAGSLEDVWWELDVMVLQGWDSLDAFEPRLNPETQLGVLWISDDPLAAQALRELPLSAWGLLSSEASTQELIAAIHAIHQGMIVAPRERFEGLWIEIPPNEAIKPIEQLTPRETEILEQLALGLANKQIALELGISEHTVKFHVSSIYAKLGVTNRMEAVREGLQLGLITL